MKLFVGLSAAVSLTVLLGACSSSSPPSDDAGVTDGSADGTTDGAGSCTPVAPSAGSVPTFTSPAIGQGVCGSDDITAFVAACAVDAAGTPPTAACDAWLQSMSTAACRQCLLGTNNKIGVFDSVTFSGQATIIPSLGACILGVVGSATPPGCPAAAEPLVYCADEACSHCSGTAKEVAACVSATTGGVCSQYVGGLTNSTTGCGTVVGMAATCQPSLGTAAELTAAATVICGSAEAGPSEEGGAGEAGASDSGSDDGGGGDGSASDSGVTDSGAADSSAADSSISDAGAADAADSGG
jgi:hypothetical protein